MITLSLESFFMKPDDLGETDGKFFRTTKTEKEHYFRKFDALFESMSVLNRLKNSGVKWILIEYHKNDGTVEVYDIAVDSFMNSELKYVNGSSDLQRGLTMEQLEQETQEWK